MSDLFFSKKKNGMTIAKAWMLLVGAIVCSFGVFAIIALVIREKFDDEANPNDIEPLLLLVFVFFWTGAGIIGYYINDKEGPFFKRSNSVTFVLVCIISCIIFYVSSALGDIFEFKIKKLEFQQNILHSFTFDIIAQLLFTILQILIIGHGLLRNYKFQKAFYVICITSIFFIMPEAVVELLFSTIFLVIIYYRTGSGQLVILGAGLPIVLEHILKYFYFQEFYKYPNLIRSHLIDNDLVYYGLLTVAIIALVYCLEFLKKQNEPITWLKSN